MHVKFHLYHVDSSVVINVLTKYIMAKIKQPKVEVWSILHEYASEFTSTPKAELFCSCTRRKFIGQNLLIPKSKFKFLGQKIGCRSCNPKSR